MTDLAPRTPAVPVPYAESIEGVPYTKIRELGEIAMALDGVLRLYFGESTLGTPRFIVDAAVRALREGFTFYSENAGLPGLRGAIARQYSALHGLDVDPASQIVVTAGGVQALHLGIRSALEPGEEAIVLSPAWPNSTSIIRLSHGIPVDVPLQLDHGRYRIDFEQLEAAITPRTRLVILTSPSNPLGWTASVEEQEQLLSLCRERAMWLIADEVYERIYYGVSGPGEAAPSILRLCEASDRVHVVQSFSKAYRMTGWRVGFLVTRPDVGPKLAELNEFFVSHAATFAQVAAQTAVEEGEAEIREMVEMLAGNRELAVETLRTLPGVTVPDPSGAFYLFPRIEGLGDSFAFCRRLLEQHRVGLAPGSAFGAGGEGSIRICYAVERATLEAALERLAAFLVTGEWH